MKMPKEFNYYVLQGVVVTCSPNKQKAEFLVKESASSLEGLKERVEKIGIHNKNANSIIKDCYDIIMELVRAKLFIDGFTSSGQYAHEAEVSYLKELNFTDQEVFFLNGVRYFRNSITYYGKILDKDYAEKVYNFLNKIYPKLKECLSNN